MKTLTAEEQAMYREMLGARKRLQATDKDAMELVMDLVVDFGLWLERRKPKRKLVPTGRKFTPAQQESGFANYPEPEISPAQRAEPKRRRTGDRQRRSYPVLKQVPKSVAQPSIVQLIKNTLTEYGPQTNVQIAEKLGWRDADAAQRVSARTYQLVARGEIIKHAEFPNGTRKPIFVFAMPGTPPDASYSRPAPKAAQIEPKRRPDVVKPSRKYPQHGSPQRAPALPERIHIMLQTAQLTNAEIAERLGLPVNRNSTTRISTLTSRMHQRGELVIVGTQKKKGSPAANVYAAGAAKTFRQYEKAYIITRVMEWLKTEGVKTREQIAEYLGENEDSRSAVNRLLRYGMAHVVGQTISKRTGRPLKLYAYGPEPRKGG